MCANFIKKSPAWLVLNVAVMHYGKCHIWPSFNFSKLG